MNGKSILPLSLCLLLTACATVEPTSTPPGIVQATATAEPAPTAAPTPTPVWGEQVYLTAFAAEGRDEPVFSPDYRLPFIENADGITAYETINAYYATALDDLAVSAAEVAGWAIDDYYTTQATGDPFFNYVDTESYELTLQTASRVSILRSHYSNSGGAYPTLYPLSDTFDLTTGERLELADLFSRSAEETEETILNAVLALNAEKAFNHTVLDETALQEGFSTRNFYLTEDALTIYFPELDLPRAVGTPTFAIPYTELGDTFLPID